MANRLLPLPSQSRLVVDIVAAAAAAAAAAEDCTTPTNGVVDADDGGLPPTNDGWSV